MATNSVNGDVPAAQFSSDDDDSFVVLGNSLTDLTEHVDGNIVKEIREALEIEIDEINSINKIPRECSPMKLATQAHLSRLSAAASIMSNDSCEETTEDPQIKVNQLVEENAKLRATIAQNNINMNTQYDRVTAWCDDVEKVHKSYKNKVLEAKEFIEQLHKEKCQLQNELDECRKLVDDKAKLSGPSIVDGTSFEDQLRIAEENMKGFEPLERQCRDYIEVLGERDSLKRRNMALTYLASRNAEEEAKTYFRIMDAKKKIECLSDSKRLKDKETELANYLYPPKPLKSEGNRTAVKPASTQESMSEENVSETDQVNYLNHKYRDLQNAVLAVSGENRLLEDKIKELEAEKISLKNHSKAFKENLILINSEMKRQQIAANAEHEFLSAESMRAQFDSDLKDEFNRISNRNEELQKQVDKLELDYKQSVCNNQAMADEHEDAKEELLQRINELELEQKQTLLDVEKYLKEDVMKEEFLEKINELESKVLENTLNNVRLREKEQENEELLQKLQALELELKQNELECQKKLIDEVQQKEEAKIVRQQLMNAQMRITALEADLAADKKQFEKLEKKDGELTEKIFALEAQLEIYKNDFEAERSAKETIKAEKDNITDDMQQLQRRNQQLQEEIELIRERNFVYVQRGAEAPASAPARSKSPPVYSYTCPICNQKFRSYRLLEDHIESCIPDN